MVVQKNKIISGSTFLKTSIDVPIPGATWQIQIEECTQTKEKSGRLLLSGIDSLPREVESEGRLDEPGETSPPQDASPGNGNVYLTYNTTPSLPPTPLLSGCPSRIGLYIYIYIYKYICGQPLTRQSNSPVCSTVEV